MNREMQRFLVHLVTAIGENTRTPKLPGLIESLHVLHVCVDGRSQPDLVELLQWAEYHSAGTVAEPIAAFLGSVAAVQPAAFEGATR